MSGKVQTVHGWLPSTTAYQYLKRYNISTIFSIDLPAIELMTEKEYAPRLYQIVTRYRTLETQLKARGTSINELVSQLKSNTNQCTINPQLADWSKLK